MKTSKNIFNRKASAFLGAAAFMFAAVFIAGCKTEVSSSDPVPETFALTFKPGEHGSVDAKAGGKAVATGAKLEKGTTVEFTATPESGYEVDKWTVTGGELVEGTGAEGSTTAKVKVTGDVTVNVSFKAKVSYAVTLDSIDPAKKADIIEAVSKIPGLDTGKAAAIVENAPQVIKDGLTKAEADEIIEAITKAGGTASKSDKKTYTVEATAGEHGTIEASPKVFSKVLENTEVTFTATPESGYEVDKWTVTGGELVEGTGAEGSTTAKVKVTANTKVNVNFTKKSYAVTFSVNGGNGSLSAKLDGNNFTTGGQVEHGKTLEFTAKPDTDYKAEWSITGGEFESGTGTKGSTTAKVKVTGDVTVSVTFNSVYEPVLFSDLSNYLQNTASSTDVNKIEVQGLTAADLKGNSWNDASPLGKILEANSDKKVALKFGGKIEGLTDMSYCFSGCKSLTQAPVIPTGVTNMYGCFHGCTNLTQAPAIPSGVTNMSFCFSGCTNLTQAPAIPTGVTTMAGCFSGCTNLTQAPEIPTGVTNMYGCFSGCTNLTQAPAIPTGVTDMSYCFYSCTSLTQAPEIPTGVTNMEGCFRGCTNLTQAPTIPTGVTNMCGCFYDCISLTQAPAIPTGVTNMEDCFRDCTSLTQAPAIPSGVTRMYGCFRGCTSLTQAPTIPTGVTNMSYCFSGCTSLTQAPAIPSGVTNMYGCFRGCTSLTQAPEIPSGVKDMESCFSGCTSLTQAPEIPTGVTDMRWCFRGCTSLMQAPVIPTGVTDMHGCFLGCTKLESAVLKCNYNPAEIVGTLAFKDTFKDCTSLPVGGIKVPAAQLGTYRTNASVMGVPADRFAAE